MSDPNSPRPGYLGPWLKGFPALHAPLPLAEVGQQAWTLRGQDLPLPLAVLRQSALSHNIAWMQSFAHSQGVHLAPHGKTTMSPQLFQRQLAAGAWGLSFANVHQLRLGLSMPGEPGLRRALLANQLLSRTDLAELLDLRHRHPGLELAFFVDSLAQLDLLAGHWQRLGAAAAGEARLDVLIELGSSRCGVREHGPALALARRLQKHPALRLRGLAFYEGLELQGEIAADQALMQHWQARVETLLAAIEAEQLLEAEAQPLWLSAGGSALFDLVAPVLAGEHEDEDEGEGETQAGRPLRLGLLRSGCYICHDHGLYARMGQAIDARMRHTLLGGPQLQAALEVWTEVLSCPEPGLALLNAGRRDVSFDQGWPLPVWHLPRPLDDEQAARLPAPAGWAITGLNDQHAYLRWDPAACAGPAVGERVVLGPSHPCTTFDKWAWMAVVDDEDRVVEAITTQFS
ncbi:amino acid deaminase [Paucibacter sp. KBW04]|uniref:alanine racemase n=1 Tax=Paucibacter sp. KBW04 TaxID=2153361 RepID=UPI000F55DDC3|nr:alanine racemase [Paucibacter sp. KBW04]RQO61138.1 amino acid deaminase [Paucibacter sp. KBW04]